VEEALAARDAAIALSSSALTARLVELEGARRRIAELELVAEGLSDRVVAREAELARLRGELERMRAEYERGMRSLIALGEELEAVRSTARGQATRIRMSALRDAAEISERITEAARRPAEARERLLEALGEAIRRIGRAEEGEVAEMPVSSNGHAPGRSGDEVFAGMVEVEIGPLEDFSQLVGFEDAADGIAATSEISVKRFASGRATLEMKLGEPVELLRELEERAPFEFKVRDQRSDRLILDVDAE
jgi:hypothetical protein